jgi:3-hydroxy-9,10-secoandrosta-1,3,5(10)-triene-9,17-dione monooxygenase reductase component
VPEETIDSRHFRTVLGHFPTGVTAVTAIDEGKPVGMAVGSFTSVSLDPPLVAFLPARNSVTWARIRRAGQFCVNILSASQLDLCGTMASRSDEKFTACSWRQGVTGSPIIDGALAWIECEIDAVHEAGDHDIVVGRVLALEADTEGSGTPLLFFRGGYGAFDGGNG